MHGMNESLMKDLAELAKEIERIEDHHIYSQFSEIELIEVRCMTLGLSIRQLLNEANFDIESIVMPAENVDTDITGWAIRNKFPFDVINYVTRINLMNRYFGNPEYHWVFCRLVMEAIVCKPN